MEELELLEELVQNSNRYELNEGVLMIQSYYDNNKKIGINLIGLIELICENDIQQHNLDNLFLSKEELEYFE